LCPTAGENPPQGGEESAPRVKIRKKDDPETARLQDDKFRHWHIQRKEIELSKSTHENGGAIFDHGSGGIVLLRAA
jgi:hypothetical protein